jgi:prefoldin subunit 5
MEANTTRRLEGLNEKIPDIRKTLEMVQFLQTRTPESDELETTFELNDTLFAKASVPYTDEVYLWLGANVMLAYPLEEAQTLLKDKLDGAEEKMKDCEEDIDFLREQITVRECQAIVDAC